MFWKGMKRMAEQVIITTMPRIDTVTAPKFEAEVKALFAEGTTDLVMDLENTVYVSSAGLRVFLFAQKKVNAAGGSLVLRNVKPQIMEIFEVTGFSGILTFE